MKTKEINGSLFLIDENAEIKKGDKYLLIPENKIKEAYCDMPTHRDWEKVIAQQFIDGKTDYIIDTLFEIESTSTDEEIEVEFVMEYYPPVIGGGLIINNEIGRKGLTRYEGCLKPKTHTKEINNKEYKCLTIKYK